MNVKISDHVAALRSDLLRLRRELHSHPELAFREERTAALVAHELRGLGLEVRTGIGETGVMAVLPGAEPGRTLLLRADMDALPLEEQSQVDYRSQTPGVMHACGHDGHTAIAVGLAKLLVQRRAPLKGSLKLLFQPAEEAADGATAMLREGVLQDPPVDAVLGFHLWNPTPLGVVGVRPGPIFAGADEFRIVVKGQGGHGAMPQQTIDAIAVASQVVVALQNLVSRETSPLQSAVISIGAIRGGRAFNVIADEVVMSGTMRTFDAALRERLIQRMDESIKGITSASRASYEFTCRAACPPVINDPAMAKLVRGAAVEVVGESNIDDAAQSMTGDDFAYYLLERPGCYFLVGSSNPEKGLDKPHHHPQFDFDEDAMLLATAVLEQAAIRYLV